MIKIGVVFDNRRNDTTGNYVLKSLLKREELKVSHIPTAYWKDASDEFDLYVIVDDGVPAEWPKDKFHPSVYWVIDGHIDYKFRLDNALTAKVDHIFCAQKNRMLPFLDAGFGVSWIPLACDPDIHSLDNERHECKYDIAAVCHTNPFWKIMDTRVKFFSRMFKEFPNFFYGQRYLQDATRIYKQSKIILNQSVLDDVNMRCFEATCSGSLLLTNHIDGNGFSDLFRDHGHLVTFRSIDEAVDKANYFLENEGIREEVAAEGAKHVKERHTYDHRVDDMLAFAEASGWIFDAPYLKQKVLVAKEA